MCIRDRDLGARNVDFEVDGVSGHNRSNDEPRPSQERAFESYKKEKRKLDWRHTKEKRTNNTGF